MEKKRGNNAPLELGTCGASVMWHTPPWPSTSACNPQGYMGHLPAHICLRTSGTCDMPPWPRASTSTPGSSGMGAAPKAGDVSGASGRRSPRGVGASDARHTLGSTAISGRESSLGV